MNIIYKRLSETEINTVIKLRIEQLTEEYTSAGKTVPEGTIYVTASDVGVKLYEAYGFKHNGNFM